MSSIAPITVGFTVDENYVQHLGVTMSSMLHNRNSDFPIHIVVIGDGLSEESLEVLTQIAQNKNATITFPEVVYKDFNTLKLSPIISHVSRASFARLAISAIIDVDKVIFLDCDLLVRKDISALWNIDISEYYSGAVIDSVVNARYGQDDHRRRLGMPPEVPYYNTGVLLLNLKKCRQDDVMENALRFLVESTDFLHFHEQDSLNVAMCNNIFPLHPRWNVQTDIFRTIYNAKRSSKFPSEIIEAVKDPAVVHFTEAVKPWHYECEIPYAEEYYKYLAMTPWKDYQPAGWTFRGMMKKNRHLFKRRLKSAMLGYRV